MKVLISRQAEEDLSESFAYLAVNNSDAAERFKTETKKALIQLSAHPELGPHPGWETRHPSLRFWVINRFHNYLIYYEVREAEVSIERVLDGRRDVRRIVEEGLEEPADQD